MMIANPEGEGSNFGRSFPVSKKTEAAPKKN